MDKLSMSLDDIIKQNKDSGSVRQRGRNNSRNNFQNNRGRNRLLGESPNNRFTPYKKRGNIDTQWQHDLYDGNAFGVVNGTTVSDNNLTKLLISNLDFGVSDYDLAELFAEFGTLISAEVHYDRSGRSLGTAEVIFKNKSSATRALNFYNGVPLDGRPMNIRLLAENAEPKMFRPARGRSRPGPVNRRRGGYRRAGGEYGRSTRGRYRNNITSEQLDAELDNYVNES